MMRWVRLTSLEIHSDAGANIPRQTGQPADASRTKRCRDRSSRLQTCRHRANRWSTDPSAFGGNSSAPPVRDTRSMTEIAVSGGPQRYAGPTLPKPGVARSKLAGGHRTHGLYEFCGRPRRPPRWVVSNTRGQEQGQRWLRKHRRAVSVGGPIEASPGMTAWSLERQIASTRSGAAIARGGVAWSAQSWEDVEAG
jgi:hypothetical protein